MDEIHSLIREEGIFDHCNSMNTSLRFDMYNEANGVPRGRILLRHNALEAVNISPPKDDSWYPYTIFHGALRSAATVSATLAPVSTLLLFDVPVLAPGFPRSQAVHHHNPRGPQ